MLTVHYSARLFEQRKNTSNPQLWAEIRQCSMFSSWEEPFPSCHQLHIPSIITHDVHACYKPKVVAHPCVLPNRLANSNSLWFFYYEAFWSGGKNLV